ncbi:MAG: Smr/MutS family protein [Methylococcales bacterium]|nr:DNA mismatch repair protein MutS [Methylococcaceae bacterium]
MTKKVLTPEERDLFRESVGKVQAIKDDKVVFTKKPPMRFKPKSPSVDVNDHLVNTPIDIDNVGQEDSMSYLAFGLQNAVLKKLRRGHFGRDAEIDLHGLTGDEAKRQLLHFLHDCVEDGCRCVHIIHGKGYRSPDNQPVLKNHLNLWLRQHKDVQAFCSTPIKAGGTGAVFVLLQLAEKYGQREEY